MRNKIKFNLTTKLMKICCAKLRTNDNDVLDVVNDAFNNFSKHKIGSA